MTSPTPSVRRPTIYDVAQAAGVSKSLVSLVLQGSAHVSPARRAAVEAAIAALGYRPSRAAAALAGERTRTVGVLIDDYRNLWFTSLLDGLQSVLAPLGLRTTVEDVGQALAVPGPAGPATPLDGFLALRVDGIVVAAEPAVPLPAGHGTPLVVAGVRDLEVAGAAVVTDDDWLGGRLATEHLLGLGHVRTGHLTGAGGAARARATAYAETVRDAGLVPVVRAGGGGTSEHDGYLAARRLLEEHPGTTAVFAANDTMAFGAAAAIAERGARVPEDVSLVGYDNSPLASAHLLALTTVDDRSAEVGAAAARALLALMDGAPAPAAHRVAPHLVLRSSTAPPPRP